MQLLHKYRINTCISRKILYQLIVKTNGLQISVIIMLVYDIYNKSSGPEVFV